MTGEGVVPRKRCPARENRTETELAMVDAFDVPACLVWMKPGSRGQSLGAKGWGPCPDCLPRPPLWRRVLRRLRP